MKIQREVNGMMVEFELTPEELSGAYNEQQHLFDVQDIKDKIEGEMDPGEFEEEYGVPADLVLQNDALLNEIARESRHNQDHYGQEWQYARDDAIREVLDQHRNELLAPQEDLSGPDKVFPGLPERCFGVLPGTGDLILIARGESGYYRTDWTTSDPEKNRELANGHNAEMGVSKAQAAAMLAGSMFGWHVPAANPAAYDEHGELKRDSLADKIVSAEQKQAEASLAAVEMSYSDLCKLFRNVERSGNGHVSAYIVFTEDSFTPPYSEESRTYGLSSDNKAFQPGMGGYSIYGSCLDGTDPCLRMDAYMAAEKGGKNGWKIERCYMPQAEYDKANSLINNIRDSRNDGSR